MPKFINKQKCYMNSATHMTDYKGPTKNNKNNKIVYATTLNKRT